LPNTCLCCIVQLMRVLLRCLYTCSREHFVALKVKLFHRRGRGEGVYRDVIETVRWYIYSRRDPLRGNKIFSFRNNL
jgi:hypothetical protein